MRLLAWACAVVIAAAVVTRYPPIGAHVSHVLATVVDAVVGAALFAAVAAESRMKRGDVGPLWMRVEGPPRLAMALALSFSTTMIAQLLSWSLGPVDPTFASPAPPEVHALWFFMFTLGFSGIGMMSAPSLFLPVLHPPARLMKTLKVPAIVVVIVYAAAGAGVGLAFGALVVYRPIANLVARWVDFTSKNATLVTVVMLAITVGPLLWSSARGNSARPAVDE